MYDRQNTWLVWPLQQAAAEATPTDSLYSYKRTHTHTRHKCRIERGKFFPLNFVALINILIGLNIKFAITVTYIGIWLLFLLF